MGITALAARPAITPVQPPRRTPGMAPATPAICDLLAWQVICRAATWAISWGVHVLDGQVVGFGFVAAGEAEEGHGDHGAGRPAGDYTGPAAQEDAGNGRPGG